MATQEHPADPSRLSPNFLTTSWNAQPKTTPPSSPSLSPKSSPILDTSVNSDRTSGTFERMSGTFERALVEINGGEGSNQSTPQSGVRPVKDDVDLWRDLTRVPFSIWVFLMGFLIFRLFSLAQELQSDRDQFQGFIFNSCVIVQNASNQLINLHKTVANDTIGGIADLANDVTSTGMKALTSTVDMVGELTMVLLQIVTAGARCISVAAASMATQYYFTNQAQYQSQVNNIVNLAVTPFENAAEQTKADLVGTVLNNFNNYISSYNAVAQKISDAGIPLLNMNIQLFDPNHLASVIPPPGYIAAPSLPNSTQWVPPNYDAVINGFFNSLNPQKSLDALVAKIPVYHTSAQQLIAQMNLTSELQKSELFFCEEINWQSFDTATNVILDAVWGTAAALCVLLVLMVSGEAAVVVYQHKKGSLRPSWCPEGGTLDTFVKYIWYKPSMTCLFVGLLGIAIFKGLERADQEAKRQFELYVIADIREYSFTTLANINQQLDQISYKFTGLVNTQIDDFVQGFDNMRTDVNNTLNQIVNLQSVANNYLNQHVGTVDPIAGPVLVQMINCMASFLNLPVGDIVNLIPNMDNLPRLDPRLLTFNLTKAELIVNVTLGAASYPFDDYQQKFENDVSFFYYMTAYGAPVFLLGVVFAIWDLAMNMKVRR